MDIENNTLVMDDGRTIVLPKHAIASRVKIWRVPADYRADGVFAATILPNVPEEIPACNLADCEVLGELDYPADGSAQLMAARSQRLATVRAAVDAAAQGVLAATPSLEQHSWPTQLAEARRVQAYAAAPDTLPAEVAPLLSLMAVSRGLGESVVELAGKVLAAATEHAVTISPLLGRWQQIRRELEQASSLDALLAVDTSLSRPD